jgi:peptidoglycan/LPS O-acetylase OafA/YrhL
MTTPTPKQELYQNRTKIEELESIRGLAALLVVFFHISECNIPLDIGIIKNGYLMVDLFFVLSGYVIYIAYAHKITNRSDLFRFQFLRFGRLYPVHFVFLVVFIFIEIAKYIAQSKFGITGPDTQPFKENNLTAIVRQLFLVQAIGPTNDAFTFNAPAWSISVEFYTYFIFGVFVLLVGKKKEIFFSIIVLFSLILLVWKTTFGFNDLFRCLAGFFIGCLTASATKAIKINISKYASLLVLVSIVFFLQLKTTNKYDVAIYFFTAALIASLVLSKDGYLNYVLHLKILTWLGSVSYAVYMSHATILWLTNQIIRFILKKPEILVPEKSTRQLNNIETLIACGLVVLIVLVFSTLVYRFIEKPMREKSRRFAFDSLN